MYTYLVGGENNNFQCIPHVSKYSDCTQGNVCSGCNVCTCNSHGAWSCHKESLCPGKNYNPVDDNTLDKALANLKYEIENKDKFEVEAPKEAVNEGFKQIAENMKDVEKNILKMMSRRKRSPEIQSKKEKISHNSTTKFFNVVDELNEDTLKHTNNTGTIEANKIDATQIPVNTRRSSFVSQSNSSPTSPLHISYKHPNSYHNPITDSKINAAHHKNDKIDDLAFEKFQKIANKTLLWKNKDKDLSKIVVNELKTGKEIVGDIKAPVVSNISFTPENDTLTAMALIAGNLLNKLWNIEKDINDESLETEMLKHEKIADLLDLFKEPLTLRQETFLKNTLEKLSDVLNKNKNIKNVSLCNIDDAQETLSLNNNQDPSVSVEKTNCDHRKKGQFTPNNEKNETASKLNNIVTLLKSFDDIQTKLSNINKTKLPKKENLRSEESSSDVYGNLLEKITKLLIPDKANKVKNKIRNQFNIRTNSLKNKIKDLFDIDLENVSLTPKDKLVLEYLHKIDTNPKCLLGAEEHQTGEMPNLRGNIMLNLSEFLKIKSITDLLRLVDLENHALRSSNNSLYSTTPVQVSEFTMPEKIKGTTETSYNVDESKLSKLEQTKQKLKSHLKTIIDDLIELQHERGIPAKEIKISDALPCIYNILNADSGNRLPILPSTPTEKIESIFESLKKELHTTALTRRTDSQIINLPRSAEVWERLVNHLSGKNNLNRRSIDRYTDSYEELQKKINNIESLKSTSAFKNYTFMIEVPAADKLMFLKTLLADVNQYLDVLEHMKKSLNEQPKLENDLKLIDFVQKAALDLNKDENFVKNLRKSSFVETFLPYNSNRKRPLSESLGQKQAFKMSEDFMHERRNKDVRLSRDQVLNQLIKNRVQLYLKNKNYNTFNAHDINYNIATRILYNLERGNDQLARQLFKVFVSNKEMLTKPSDTANQDEPFRKMESNPLFEKEPLIEFENINEYEKVNSVNDKLLKQLISIKDYNMKN